MYVRNLGLFASRIVASCSIRPKSNDSSKKLLEFLAEMPKTNTYHVIGTQQQRKKAQKKAEKYGSSTVYLQVLGSGSRGVPNTVYLFTDQKRYLFNCGEGTQRLAHEHKVKLSRLENIFITNKTWQNIGGLPGLSLTLQDVGVPNITLHGPEGLDDLYNATRRFVIMKDMKVTMHACRNTKEYVDNVMTVKYVLLHPTEDCNQPTKPSSPPPKKYKTNQSKLEKELESFMHDETDYYMRETSRRKSPPPRSFDHKRERVPVEIPAKLNSCSVAYICTLKKRLGTLDLEKCVAMGVKPGPLLGQLKHGHNVTLPDGKIVLAKNVKSPDEPGAVFIVIEVPEIGYLNQSKFESHFHNSYNPPENVPAVIVHMTPPHVLNHPEYLSFMANFGPQTKHLIVNEMNSCLGSEAVHRTQYKLHLLDPEIFPLLRDDIPKVWNTGVPTIKKSSPERVFRFEELKKMIMKAQLRNYLNLESLSKAADRTDESSNQESVFEARNIQTIMARTLTVFHLKPKKDLDRSLEPKLHIQDYLQETIDVDGFFASLVQFRHIVENMRYAKANDEKEFPKLVFLGTGSCIPSKTRNTSAIVLQIDENRSILLDCGEGTFGQLTRFYGPSNVGNFLRTLQAIYISHLHADHHIGLIGVLQARRQALIDAELPPDPVYLLAPGQIISWLTTYDWSFEKIQPDFTLIPNQNFIHVNNSKHQVLSITLPPQALASLGIQDIEMCYVNHCPNAFGVALTLETQQKITYSGDTIPCEALAVIGQNSTLLIHEATMEDELATEARTKMHSTTTQAIEMGQKMDAQYTILTHFSQRYARLPRLNPHILHDNTSIGIAFDHMQVSMFDLRILPQMYAPLQLMFAEHCVEMELKAENRKRQKILARQNSTDSITSTDNKDNSSLVNSESS